MTPNKIQRGKRRKKPEAVILDNYFFYKDKEGVVWQVIKTPYKDIPVSIINWNDVFTNRG